MKSTILVTALAALLSVTCAQGEERVRFNRDVRPILSDKCFQCHGPDAKQRKADLRLDDRAQALKAEAIVVGEPESSELVRRILTEDPAERMPPASSKLGALTEREIDTLRRWIKQGAEYENHWAFIPLNTDPGRGGDAAASIDQTVSAGLAARSLALQPEADRASLIRRLCFDLTGLPPTPAEIDLFLKDSSANAYEKLVDRLLASEHYGERMAVDWLDVARYADSYGFQVDREREMWPWRDWVVRALNANQPFHEFIIWQLAGDLLPNATDEQILATAFNRLHQQETEGGSVEEEYRVEYVCDRVQTVATAFLGLTFECCRCHDHKYDPITQREYYQLFSMFQNIDEAGLYSYFTPSMPTPTVVIADEPTKLRLAALRAKVEELEGRTPAVQESRRAQFEKWLDAQRVAGANVPQAPAEMSQIGELARFRCDTIESNKLANSIKADQPATLHGENKLVEGRAGQAIEFTGDDPVDLPLGNFSRQQPFSIALWLKTPDEKERAVVLHRSRAWTDAASRGYELLIEEGRLKWSLIHFWPGNAISIAAMKKLPINEWVHVVVSSDGSSRAAGLRLSINGRPAPTVLVRDNLSKDIQGGGGDNIALGERFRDRGFKGGAIDDLRIFGRQLAQVEVESVWRDVSPRQILAEQLASAKQAATRARLFEFYLASADSEWAAHQAALLAARTELNTQAEGLKELMVMRELPQPKKAYVLFRGEYAQRREEVQPGTPAALLPFPEESPRNRLGLARWLTDPRHPLTSRVVVNRVWQSLFGRGLVKTSEDFGSQGARPLYPDVLDALAKSLIDSGWDMKRLVKTIVMTRVYRQRSLADPKTLADDPDNEWLARGPRFRLPAEMIRDNALAASGLLSRTQGGPPVNPYEMSESFKPAAPSGGDGVYRRSLYTNWRRTGPPPALVAFDAPRRAVCAVKRERTDSPLQALILLNGVQYVEAARVLGETLHREAKGNLPAMIEQAFLRCLSRPPDAREVEIVSRLYREQLAHFTEHAEDAEQLLKIGSAPHDATISAPQAAAATMLAQALLNHDSSVVKP
jgi:Protein of unknown function (DUF1553)/Protein of unknown function (DUF1549)/Concanavalin A-like lectin/glucanases superfamily/Planctomycete cytochrome C